MANFFINRPVFAWVIAIILMLAGALSIGNLPVAQYPSIAPPAPDHRRSGHSARDICCALPGRLFDQYTDHVWYGSRHRTFGG